MTGAAREDNLFRVMFNAVPLPLFRVTEEIDILDLNAAAQKLYRCSPELALRKRGGDLLNCINAVGLRNGCGNAEPCGDCLIREAVSQVLASGNEIGRRRITLETMTGKAATELDLLLTATPITFGGEASVLLCLEDITELTSLRSLIPICANCKKIRDDQQLWSSVESYFARFMRVDFTHGICPDCAKSLYPDFYAKCKR
jgi:PAS domain-containing protein